jgi:hypothetical protein
MSLSCSDPQFLFRQFLHLLESQAKHPLAHLFDLQKEARLSYFFDFSAIQDSFRFRALNRARTLALALVDEKGEIKKDLLQKLIVDFEAQGFIFYPDGLNDSLIYEHILNFLKRLNDGDLIKSIRRFQTPLCHKWAEQLVQETLNVSFANGPTNAQIRAAVLVFA